MGNTFGTLAKRKELGMAWKELLVEDQRMRFVLSCLDDEESMACLCRRFGISRRTGYKWLARYRQEGTGGLTNRSRAAQHHPNQVEAEIEEQILSLRADHPTWGARKLLVMLSRRGGLKQDLPAASTVGQILKRAGLIVPRRGRGRAGSSWAVAPARVKAEFANRLWCADYKGWFRTQDGSRCDALTITDAHSRFLLRCQVAAVTHRASRRLFEATFREYGLPEAIRTDNGEPFASVGVCGLSQLSVWWIRLGIVHDRIRPASPQENGAHERMHRTLKQETASPPAGTLRAQQMRFDVFCQQYNHQRPHEALPQMATPGSVYQPSSREYPHRLPELQYPPNSQLRWVDDTGKFRWNGAKVSLGRALAEQTIGLLPWREDVSDHPLNQRYWKMRFGPMELGVFDARRQRLLSTRERRLMARGGSE
jgi:putative transposase